MANEMRAMSRAESAVYKRLSDIQGTMASRLIADVELDISPEGVDIPDQYPDHF